MSAPLEIRSKGKEARVVAPHFFKFYNEFLTNVKNLIPDVPRWTIPDFLFPDGTPHFHIEPESGTEKDMDRLPKSTIVPMWYLPSDPASTTAIVNVGNALTHQEKGRRKPLSRKKIAMCMYAMLRQDGDSIDPETGERSIGQAIYSEIFANLIKEYYTALVILDPHSKKSMDYQKIPSLSITAAPLFVDWFKQKYPDPEYRKKVKLVALDKGSLQRTLRFAQLAGLNLADQVVVLNKKRKGHVLIDSSDILYGDPNGSDIILFDDLIDTSGSIQQTCEALQKRGCRKITVMATHGVLSFPARHNLKRAVDKGLIQDLVITNSLPQAAYGLDGIKNVSILDVAALMVSFSEMVIDSSIGHVLYNYDPDIQQFIMAPEDKERVWENFLKKVTSSPKRK